MVSIDVESELDVCQCFVGVEQWIGHGRTTDRGRWDILGAELCRDFSHVRRLCYVSKTGAEHCSSNIEHTLKAALWPQLVMW
jgi:hypothetical protein